MLESPRRLIRRCTEYRPAAELAKVPKGVRGIYVLYSQDREDKKTYNVVYVGMSRGRAFSRLRSHGTSEKKKDLWTHFSLFQVWDNVRDDEIVELEGLFRHIYAHDAAANGPRRSEEVWKTLKAPGRQLWGVDGRELSSGGYVRRLKRSPRASVAWV